MGAAWSVIATLVTPVRAAVMMNVHFLEGRISCFRREFSVCDAVHLKMSAPRHSMRRCRDPLAASRVAVPESVLGHVGVLVLTPACAPWLHVLSCALAVVQLALFRALKIRSQGLGGRCVVRHCNAGDASSSGSDDECTVSGGGGGRAEPSRR